MTWKPPFPTKEGFTDPVLGGKALDAINDPYGFRTRIVPTPNGDMLVRTRGGWPEFSVAQTTQALGKWVSLGTWFATPPGGGNYPKLASVRFSTNYRGVSLVNRPTEPNETGVGVYEAIPCGGSWVAGISFASNISIRFSKTYGSSFTYSFDASSSAGFVDTLATGYNPFDSSWMALTVSTGDFGSGFFEPAGALHYIDNSTTAAWVHLPKSAGYDHGTPTCVTVTPGNILGFQPIYRNGVTAPAMFFSKSNDFGSTWTTVSAASLFTGFLPPTDSGHNAAVDHLVLDLKMAVGPEQTPGVYKVLVVLLFQTATALESRVWESLDSGATWVVKTTTGLPTEVLNVEQVVHVGNDAYLVSFGDEFFYSTNGGATWVSKTSLIGVSGSMSVGMFTTVKPKTASVPPTVIWGARPIPGGVTYLYESTDGFTSAHTVTPITSNYYATGLDSIVPLYRFGRIVYVPSIGEPMDITQPTRLP